MKLLEKLFNDAVMYVAVYLLVGLCWIGAEYLFEGAIHSSNVDCWFAFYLTWYIVRDLNRLQDKLADAKKREADHE